MASVCGEIDSVGGTGTGTGAGAGGGGAGGGAAGRDSKNPQPLVKHDKEKDI